MSPIAIVPHNTAAETIAQAYDASIRAGSAGGGTAARRHDAIIIFLMSVPDTALRALMKRITRRAVSAVILVYWSRNWLAWSGTVPLSFADSEISARAVR